MTGAARVVVGRMVDGWGFWRVRHGGEVARLGDLRPEISDVGRVVDPTRRVLWNPSRHEAGHPRTCPHNPDVRRHAAREFIPHPSLRERWGTQARGP